MRNWNLRLGRVAGIPIEIHWTFWLLLMFVFVGDFSENGDTNAAFSGVFTVVAIFTCVVLHEFGHALAALRFGVKTRDITLYPIGGVARLERIPENPVQELVIAIAGPLVNIVIVAILLAMGTVLPEHIEDPSALVKSSILSRLLLVNTSLVIFNLLPAFPMDGGRIFRAFLALFMDYAQATRIAASVGQLMAIIFVFVGLSGNTMLLFIAFFVWLGASSEATSVEQRVLLKSSLVRDAMLINYETVSDQSTIESVIQLLLKGSQSEFPVHQALTGEPLGVLSRNMILSSLAEKGPGGLVRDCPLDKLGRERGSRPLVAVSQQMRENGQTCLEVTDDSGQIIGLLTQDNLSEFIMVQSALKYRET